MLIGTACLFLAAAPASAATPISSAEDIVDNSIFDGGSQYTLNPGDYSITPGSRIVFTPNTLILDNSTSVLTANNSGQSGSMLNLSRLIVGPGTVNATGGQASSTHAIYTSGTTINAGAVVNALGGTSGSTSGIWTSANGVVQNGGNVTATGGSGSLSAGIYLAGGSYSINGGSLLATGGTGTNTTGVRVTSGGFNILGGTVTAQGGLGGIQQSSGITVTGTGGVRVDGGSLTAIGGNSSQNYGLSAQYRVLVDSGIVTAQGGTGSNTAGIRLLLEDFYQNGGTVNATAGSGFVAAGIYGTSNTYHMNGGTLNTFGGGSGNTHGLMLPTLSIQQGTVTATGSSTSLSRGISATTISQTGGTLEAIGATGGPTAASSVAVYAGTYTAANSVIRASGGSGTSTRGLYVAGNFSLTDSSLTATGGAGNRSYGVHVIGPVTQSGGSITATGGDGTEAHGLLFAQSATLDGSLTTTGGGGAQAYGSFINGILSHSGSPVTAEGGAGSMAYGLYANDVATLDGSSLAAAGGTGSQAVGAYFNTSLEQTNASTTATGGGTGAHGLYVNNSAILSSSGLTTAGGADQTYGSYINGSLTQDNAPVVAMGGVGTEAYGLYVTDSTTLDSSSLTTTGGSGNQAHGSAFASLDLTSTQVVATGGNGAGAHGLDALSIQQNGGLIIATGGAVQNNAYGVNIRTGGSASIGGQLRLERPGSAASMHLAGGSNLALGENSLLVPVVDIARIDSSPLTASGLISGDGSVDIPGGAAVSPYFIDTRNLLKSRAIIEIPFIELTGSGRIDGEFDHIQSGYFLEYTIDKLSDQEYAINVVRNHEIIEEVPYLECNNSRGLITLMDNVLNQQPANRLASNVWTGLDNSQSEEDWRRRAAHVGKTMAPLSYTKLTQSLVRVADLTRYDFSRQLDNLAGCGRAAARSEGALANMPVDPTMLWQVWASPLYQQSSHFRPVCYEFDDVKEKFYGGAFGFGRNLGNIALGAAYHYVHGKYNSDYTDIKTDNHGFTVGAEIHDLLPTDGWINPWLSVMLGHTWSDIDLDSRSYDYLARSADPDARTFTAEAEIGNRFQLLSNLSLSPKIGVEYSHVSQGGYTDRTSSVYGISVRKGAYDSLKPKIGFDVYLQVTDRLSLGASAHYRYETMDKRSSFFTEAVNLPDIRFVAEGENLHRSSGRFGLGTMYRINDRAAVQINYDLSISEKYMAHQLYAGIRFAF
jgi:Autotransporter beta-domain.